MAWVKKPNNNCAKDCWNTGLYTKKFKHKIFEHSLSVYLCHCTLQFYQHNNYLAQLKCIN